MKKILAIMLTLVLVSAIFAGCSSRDKKPSSSSELSSSSESSAISESSSSEISESSDDSESASSTEEVSRPSLELSAENNAKMDEAEITLLQFEAVSEKNVTAEITTNKGKVKMVLFPEEAPKAVENFVKLAEEGFYNGKLFHFVEDGYLIQGGAVNSNGSGSRTTFKDASGNPEYIEVEPSWNLWHFRGAVSLVNTNNGLGGSQFAIIQANDIYGYKAEDLEAAKFPKKVIDKYTEVGGTPHRDSYSTVIGMVVEGMDIVDLISASKTDVTGAPEEKVLIESIVITKPNVDDVSPASTESSSSNVNDTPSESSKN